MIETKIKRQGWRAAAHINWLLNLTLKSKEADPGNLQITRWSKTELKDFDGSSYLFGFGDPNSDIYLRGVTWDCLSPGFDSRAVIVGVTSGDFPIIFSRVRHAKISELRGLPLKSDKVVALYVAGLQGERRVSSKGYFQYLPNGKWAEVVRETDRGFRRLSAGVYLQDPLLEVPHSEHESHLNMGLIVAFSQQYQWQVQFRNQYGFSIKIAVDPKRIPQLFKLREKYDDRRKALRHFVSHHWRNYDGDDTFDIATFVRDHLRGQLEFQWFDLKCTVIIPPALLTDLRKRKIERSLMRLDSPRSDRRRLFASAAR